VRSGRGLVLVAIVVPALLAAAATVMLIPEHVREAPHQVATGSAARLAHMAELRPIVLHGRRTGLGTGPSGLATTATRPGVPTSFAIPSLGVDASIEPVGATETGIEVPRIGRAGWFDAGPRPGEPGRAVLIGHLDGKTIPGVFQHVPELPAGAQIVVRDSTHRIHRYEVVGKLQVEKNDFPASAVYGPSERPVLVLITCGGVYVPGEGYSSNVIVYARLVA
jgi:sortase (surface protein transpeptidase)